MTDLRENATYPEDDPIIVTLLEAHAILAGEPRPAGMTASPGPREKAMARIEKAIRLRTAESRFHGESCEDVPEDAWTGEQDQNALDWHKSRFHGGSCPGYPDCTCPNREWSHPNDPHGAFGPPGMMGG